MLHRTKIRMATSTVAALLFTYLLLAYFVIPEIWIFHDADRVAKVGNMVTTTEQGIPGDPINRRSCRFEGRGHPGVRGCRMGSCR